MSGIVEKAKETFAGTYRICITLGVVLCILGVVPLLAVSIFFGNNGYAVILATDALLIVVGDRCMAVRVVRYYLGRLSEIASGGGLYCGE